MPFDLPTSAAAPVLLHGDCLDLLRLMPDACVDVVITDPPAGVNFMSKTWDSFRGYEPQTPAGRMVHERLRSDGLILEAARKLIEDLSTKALGEDLLALASVDVMPDWARGFVAFLVDVWSEVDRVLKPGGFVCAWALPKTADLAGMAMRAVGWEIHDSLLHLFGGGRPAGINVGKSIDAMHGATREVVGGYQRPDGTPRNYEGWSPHAPTAMSGSLGDTRSIATAPATDDAKRWDGWHSQLAPGHEQWLLARKPTRLTYARQVLTHCTGALHVDACRIPRGEADREAMRVPEPAFGVGGATYNTATGVGRSGRMFEPSSAGSWPRNVMISRGGECCPVEGLDRQSGVTTSGIIKPEYRASASKSLAMSGPLRERPMSLGHPDTGGASRFFTQFDSRVWYGGKISRRTIPGTTTTIKHPTSKNPDLIDWLTALLAATCEQTGGIPALVLDPFAGSGTGAVSAIRKGVRWIGMERERVSVDEARARIAAALGSPESAAEANAVAPVGSQLGLL